MSHHELAQLEVVRERIEELQERHWCAEKQGKHHRAQKLAQQLHGAHMQRKQLVDRIMQHGKKK